MKRIGILLTCNDPSDFAKRFPDDGEVFKELLEPHCPNFRFDVLSVKDDEFPIDPAHYQGYVLTGSPASVHDSDPWIDRLMELVRELHAQKVPVYGSCFGHQVIAMALGGIVGPNDSGWSIGVSETEFLRRENWITPFQKTARLFSAHREQVKALPVGARIVGTSDHCPIASFAIGNHIFTSEYHPELSAEFMSALVAELADTEFDSRTANAALSEIAQGAAGHDFVRWIAKFLDQDNRSELDEEIEMRLNAAKSICKRAGGSAVQYFRDLGSLEVESKGPQDLVSVADRNVELLIREELNASFPKDGIIGEEHSSKPSTSRFVWVIDPIDGTANFVRGIHSWTVVLACIHESRTVVGVVYDPLHNEMFHCRRNGGAYLNSEPVGTSDSTGLNDGVTGIGISNRGDMQGAIRVIGSLIERGGVFYRSGSGAQALAYVACGRLIGYFEPHMNCWDCIAGMLLIEEAGGIVPSEEETEMIENGGRVLAAAPFVAQELALICSDPVE